MIAIVKKKKLTTNLDVHSSVLLEEPQYVFICSKEAAYNNKVHCDVKV